MEAEDSAPIYLTYSTDTYKVITGSALKGYKAMTGSTNSVYLADNDNVIAAYFNLGASGISTDTLYGVVKKSYKGTESNGTDTVVYLDLVTSKGIKTVETEETNNKFTKGMIVSFTGSYEKANDDVEIVSNTQTTSGSVASQGYIAISNNWSDSSKLIRPYTDLYYGNDKLTVSSAKVVSDSTVIYIDEDGYVVDEGTPSKAEELANANGYYANAFVIVNSDNEIELLVYETSNRIKDGKNEEVQLLTNEGKTANAKINSAVKALKDLKGDALKATASSSDFVTGNILNTNGVTYAVKSATEGATAEVAGKTIKVTGASLKAGNTVKVIVTVSATNGTPQNVELTLTLA